MSVNIPHIFSFVLQVNSQSFSDAFLIEDLYIRQSIGFVSKRVLVLGLLHEIVDFPCYPVHKTTTMIVVRWLKTSVLGLAVAAPPVAMAFTELLPQRKAVRNLLPSINDGCHKTRVQTPHKLRFRGVMSMNPEAVAGSAASIATIISSPSTIFSDFSFSFLGNSINDVLNMDQDTAEALAGPFFGASLFPYLAFLYFLNRPENETPKGVTVGFATCLLFVFLTIPAAIAAKLLYGVSLADSDWLHGGAESLLTVTNLITVVAFRQALNAKEQQLDTMPISATSYLPMTWLVVGLTALATVSVAIPAMADPSVHTPYLGGVMDLPVSIEEWGASHPEPENALTIATWIIHISSLVEFLVAMGFCWRWSDATCNPRWKGLTWGLLPLHSSGITACTYHLFYNQISILVPFQALLTCVGNTTAAYAAYRIARSNGYQIPDSPIVSTFLRALPQEKVNGTQAIVSRQKKSLMGFEDLGDALARDNDYSFLVKLFAGCAAVSYVIKYGEPFLDFPFQANAYLGFAVILIPSMLNAFKWYKRGQDSSFQGWF